MVSLLQRIRPRGPSLGPRWRYARPGPHKSLGVERHFLNQVSGTPFDCKAIAFSPLANIVGRSALHSPTSAYAAKGNPLAVKFSSRRSTAQAIRASLLAKATTTTFL